MCEQIITKLRLVPLEQCLAKIGFLLLDQTALGKNQDRLSDTPGLIKDKTIKLRKKMTR